MSLKFIAISLMCCASPVLANQFSDDLVAAAIARTKLNITYDGRYIAIDYPNGDVPDNIVVCTDVIIRIYRELGIDLQRLVHEDMVTDFASYPSKRMWGLSATDKNIDHRRVPNLQTFFNRHGQKLQVSHRASDYLAGDLVTWLVNGNLPHIGIVTNKKDSDSQTPLIIHNIGAGPQLQNMLFSFPITGHYRFEPAK